MSIPEILAAVASAFNAIGGALEAVPDRTLIYAAVAWCLVSATGTALYVRRKFSTARRTLACLSTEWQAAEAEFVRISQVAQRKIGEISTESPPAPLRVAPAAPALGAGSYPLTDASSDLPRQVSAMARRGLSATEIAATLGLGEADVNVLFGMYRVTQRKK